MLRFLKKYYDFFLFFFLVYGTSIFKKVFCYNELEYVFSSYMFANPSQFVFNEFFPRLNLNLYSFFALLYPFNKVFSPEVTTVLGRLIAFGAVFFVIYKIAKFFKLHWFTMSVAVLCFYKFQGYYSSEMFTFTLDPKVFSYFCLFLSIYLLIKNSLKRSLFLLGLSITFHPLVGGWGTICFLFALFCTYKNSFKWNVKQLVYFLFGASFGIVAIVNELFFVKGLAHNQKQIYQILFKPHHLDVNYFLRYDYRFILAILFTLLFLIIIKRFKTNKPLVFLSYFSLSTIGLFIIGLVVAKTPFNTIFSIYFPFRLLDIVMPMVGLFIIFGIIQFHFSEMQLNITAILVTGLLFFMMIPQIKNQIDVLNLVKKGGFEYNRVDNSSLGLLDAADWVSKNTPKDALVLTIPRLRATYWMERQNFLHIKTVPYTEDTFNNWLARIIFVNGSDQVKHKSYKLWSHLERRILTMTEAEYRRLADMFKITYLVLPASRKLSFEMVYTNQVWTVFKI